MDIVYVLGKGSKWENNEIRYSLRSVAKYLKNYGNIYVIGEKPDFLKNVIHIPCEDEFPCNKEANIALKIKKACETPEITGNFLFMNDDHFFLQEMNAQRIPPYNKGFIKVKIDHRKYCRTIINTLETLAYRQLPVFHYDVHTPIIYNKKLFLEVLDQYDWYNDGRGLMLKSLYCNTLGVSQRYSFQDLKFEVKLPRLDILSKLSGRKIFSIGDEALNEDLKSVFEWLYPNKSIFEV